MGPARLLDAAAATLAAGVVTDSTAEHYRAAFHNRVMFVAPTVSSAMFVSALLSTTAPKDSGPLRNVVYAVSIAAGLVGLGFHLTNVSRRPGGWTSTNVFHGAPMAAPLAITTAGLLSLAASQLRGNRPTSRIGNAIGALSTLGMLGTSAEATALHFRGAFQNPFMYAPVVIPPVAAASLAAAVVTRSTSATATARVLLRLTGWLGAIGVGFHAWGVHRRMGGWRNWRQNLLAGPPLPAPPGFAAMALAGLASLELLEADADR